MDLLRRSTYENTNKLLFSFQKSDRASCVYSDSK